MGVKQAIGILNRILEEDMPVVLKHILEDDELSPTEKASLIGDANTALRMLEILLGRLTE